MALAAGPRESPNLVDTHAPYIAILAFGFPY
jgi:hypothetical protein